VVPNQPVVPSNAREPYRKNLEAVEEYRSKPPTAYGWPIAARSRIFVENHADTYGGYDQQNEQGVAPKTDYRPQQFYKFLL
jgi:hypothetical protein